MKQYVIPQTTCLKVNAQTMICASAGPEPQAPGRMSLSNVTKTQGSW